MKATILTDLTFFFLTTFPFLVNMTNVLTPYCNPTKFNSYRGATKKVLAKKCRLLPMTAFLFHSATSIAFHVLHLLYNIPSTSVTALSGRVTWNGFLTKTVPITAKGHTAALRFIVVLVLRFDCVENALTTLTSRFL